MRFVDATGQISSVYDVRRVNGRVRKTAFAAMTATWRVFVGSDGRRHAYRFEPREGREVQPSLLARQLTRARWSAAFRPNRRTRR
jgi:hypothetical protein